MKNNKEIRTANIDSFNFEIKEATENEKGEMVIEGYAAVFNSITLIGTKEDGFYESIDPHAFDGADMKDVPLKYNHYDNVPILARTRNKSLVLSVDDKGLFTRAILLDTQDNRDMYKRIKAGLIDKMSIAFTVKDQEIRQLKGLPYRIIKKFERVFDVSVVDTPAYEDTSIYARSLEMAEAWKDTAEAEKSDLTYEVKTLLKLYKGE